ncbi:MAG: serine/threonine-protein kinase [Deltaproteobacteria bacterium]|nr:serine/threonine-protein kinase [Deltaproteobacteria bacterium]
MAPSDNADDVNTGGDGVQRLGRYTLMRRLGKGGMGEVFLAKSSGARGFEKQVAIKRILPQYSANKHVVNMLVDEARICVLLNHPNVVQVLELDEDEGSHFIVMEYVDGHALSRLIRRLRKRGERVEALVACFVMIGVLEGLHAAHIQKDNNGDLARIIHRDVSPQNVLLSMTGQIKVIDFGIARARDRLEATQGSQVKGKLRYMAPEQIKPSLAGSAGIDHRVDVFAAGVVLFEMLAMRQRFPQNADLEIVDAILEEETPDLRGEGSVVDDELQAILNQALAKERKKRFKDAGSFAAALRGYLYARDPAFTADRLGRLMRRCFTDDVEEADEEAPAAPVVKKGKVTVKSLPERERPRTPPEPEPPAEDDVTRTQMRPRLIAPEPVARRQRPSIPAPIIGALIGAVVLIVCGLLVKGAMKPQQLPVDGPAITSLPTSTKLGSGPAPSSSALATVGLTPAPLSSGSPPPRSDGSADPPERNAKGLVDFGGGLELVVEAVPASARISLAYQPDPKYVSPARLKVQRGETVDLLFEAEGYESSRRQFVAEGQLENGKGLHFEVKLVPIPMPLIVRPVPRDAEVLVNGAIWRSGKVNPGEELVINARHPFYVEKTVTVTAQAGQSVIVDITLDEKPPADPDAVAGPDDFDKGLERISRASKNKKTILMGVLVVTSKPLYADVFVDGKKLLSSTPVREQVTAGSHKVTVRGKNAEKTFVVDVPAGGTIKKDIALE